MANVTLVTGANPPIELGIVASPLTVSGAGTFTVTETTPRPATPATPLGASSGNVANAAAVATLAGAVGVTTYITGFQLSASGSTAALPVTATVAGLAGGTQSHTFVFPAGALVAATPLLVTFGVPMAASTTNTAITVTLPAGGAGNTNATASAQGFRV